MASDTPLDVAGRVAAAAAHDFNNHVAAISLQAELALASAAPEDEKLRRRLQGILSSCDDARELTRDLLAFGGRRALHPVRVDLAAVLEGRAVRRLSIGDRPLTVEVDPAALDDALGLLIADGDVTVAAQADGDVVELRVIRPEEATDDEARRRFFEPFVHDDAAFDLATVYGFVRQSGGTVALEPAPDGGAVVVRLPRASS